MKLLPILMIASLPLSCSANEGSAEIETPHGRVRYIEKAGKKDLTRNETVRAPSDKELQSIKDAAKNASVFILRHVPPKERKLDELDNLDVAFERWLTSKATNKESAADVEKMVGAALGEYCVSRLGVTWKVINDEHGTDFALVGEHPKSRSYPFASVRYRIEDRKVWFIGALFEALRDARNPSKPAP